MVSTYSKIGDIGQLRDADLIPKISAMWIGEFIRSQHEVSVVVGNKTAINPQWHFLVRDLNSAGNIQLVGFKKISEDEETVLLESDKHS